MNALALLLLLGSAGVADQKVALPRALPPTELSIGGPPLSLLDDGISDLRLAITAGRPVALATHMGHLIDLGRWEQPLPREADLWKRLPQSERVALHASYLTTEGIELRSMMPLALVHLYVLGSGDEGDGRPGAVALLKVSALRSQGPDSTAMIEGELLQIDSQPGRRAQSLARWSAEERGRRSGYARLFPEGSYGDPVKATYSLVFGSRDHRELFLDAFDLRYGREERLLEVRPWALGQGYITPLVGGVQPWAIPEQARASSIEMVPETRYAVRIQDDVSDLLVELNVSEIASNGVLAVAWRLVDDAAELLKSGKALRGRVRTAGGEAAAGALVWIDGPGLEELPFALRSTRAAGDGSFALPRPPVSDLPVTVSVAATGGTATADVARDEDDFALTLARSWHLELTLTPPPTELPLLYHLSANTLSLHDLTPLPPLPELPHGQFEFTALQPFRAAHVTRPLAGAAAALPLDVPLTPRSALRVLLIEPDTGLSLSRPATLSLQTATATFSLHCEHGQAYFPSLPPGPATLTATVPDHPPISTPLTLAASTLSELTLPRK
jgi:hypothetical protein